jgi:hypothetical protein
MSSADGRCREVAGMNADNAASIVEVLNAAQRNIASLANVAAGRTESQHHCLERNGAVIAVAPPG